MPTAPLPTTHRRSARHRHRSAERERRWPGRRSGFVLLALASGAVAAWLALHHPLSPALALAACVLAATLAWQRLLLALIALLALLPVIGLAPWTGWLVVEEVDLLALALAAGGYAALAWRGRASQVRSDASHPESDGHDAHAPRPPPWRLALALAALALVTSLSLVAGLRDAGGVDWSWWHGYHEALNSVRLAKPVLLTLLLVPLWMAAAHGKVRQLAFARGMTVGLALAALAVLIERLAFTGLLNFSSDYRATGPFWEMHVGGAALDAYLVLTAPFALWLALRRGHPRDVALGLVALALGGYAGLATFSRGVYLALPVALALAWLLERRRRAPLQDDATPVGPRAWLAPLLLAGFAAGTAWIFPSGGHRAWLAWWGVAVGVLLCAPLAPWRRGGPSAMTLSAIASGWLLLAAIALVLPRGAYLAFGLAFVWTLVAALAARARAAPPGSAWLAWAGLAASMACALAVARHWGGPAALLHMAAPLAAALLCLGLGAGRLRPSWPVAPGSLAGLACALGLAGLTVAVTLGGARMSERFSTVEQDFEGRYWHWVQGLALLDGASDFWFGRGLGRYVPALFNGGDPQTRIGDYRLVRDASGRPVLRLAGGRHVLDWGELLRISQRVEPPATPAFVRFEARTEQASTLHAEVCAKQLLYDDGCLVGAVTLLPRDGGWQTVQLPLTGTPPDPGRWWAPRPLVFSFAIASRDQVIEVAQVALIDARGRDLLANGSFVDGMARWFFSSDRNHLPWHAKSWPLHLRIEQGWLGLGLHAVLWAMALWRTSVGAARSAPLAPALAAALLGFALIGLFDSAVDAPRIALAYLLTLALALSLHRSAGHATAARRTRRG